MCGFSIDNEIVIVGFHETLRTAPHMETQLDNILLDFVMGKTLLKGVSPWCTVRLLSFLTLKPRLDSLVPDTMPEEKEKQKEKDDDKDDRVVYHILFLR